MHPSQLEAQAAWDRIEALGGHGVWESDLVMVSLADTSISNDDLKIFNDFPYVQILDLSGTAVNDRGLDYIEQIVNLEELIVINTGISDNAIERFQKNRPGVKITNKPPSRNSIDPFTGNLL